MACFDSLFDSISEWILNTNHTDDNEIRFNFIPFLWSISDFLVSKEDCSERASGKVQDGILNLIVELGVDFGN